MRLTRCKCCIHLDKRYSYQWDTWEEYCAEDPYQQFFSELELHEVCDKFRLDPKFESKYRAYGGIK